MCNNSLVILISGGGSNLQAIIDAIENKQLNAKISAVISNNAHAKGLQRAKKANIPCYVIPHQAFTRRALFDQAMLDIIKPLNPTLIILAGFMRILTTSFIRCFSQRMLNIHPSLLPKYKGLHTHQQALDNHDKIHGASVHYVSEELDSGIVVLQAQVAVLENDNAAQLAKRVLEQEHIIFPLCIKMHLEKQIYFSGEKLWFNDKPLNKPLLWNNKQLILPTK